MKTVRHVSVAAFRKTALIGALMATALSSGFGIGTACAADTSEPRAHSDGVGAAVSDTAVTAKVKAKLMNDSRLGKSDISVTTTNGVVTLDGTAVSADAKSAAEDIAKNVEGVKSVDNNLKAPGSSERMAKTKGVVSDSWITTKVKSELLADSMSKGFDIGVETKNGVVMLKGTLANEDAISHAKDIAAKVKGVKSVDISGLTAAGK